MLVPHNTTHAPLADTLADRLRGEFIIAPIDSVLRLSDYPRPVIYQPRRSRHSLASNSAHIFPELLAGAVDRHPYA